MANSGHVNKIYKDLEGNRQVIDSGGEIKIVPGGKITNDGTQSSKITDPSDGATIDAEARTAINAIIDALEGVGITAGS